MDGKKQTKTKWGEDRVPLHIRGCSSKHSQRPLQISGINILPAENWVTLDSYLTLNKHVIAVCSAASLQIRNIRHIQNTAARLVTRTNRDDHTTPVPPLATSARANHLQGTAAHVQKNPWQRAIIFIRVSFKLHSKQKPSRIIKKPFCRRKTKLL